MVRRQMSWVITGSPVTSSYARDVLGLKTHLFMVSKLIDRVNCTWNKTAVREHLLLVDAEVVLNILLSTISQ